MARAQAAAEHNQHQLVVIDAHVVPALFPGCGKDAGTYGIAGQDQAGFIGQGLPCNLVGQCNAGSLPCKVLVRQAHHGILLMQNHGDAFLLRSAANRHADIAAEPNHHIGLDPIEPGNGLLGGLRHQAQGLDQACRMVPVEARSLEGLEGKARLRDQTGLDSARTAREMHFVARLHQKLGNGERRVDMPGGATSGKHDYHFAATSFRDAFPLPGNGETQNPPVAPAGIPACSRDTLRTHRDSVPCAS